jgi:hypothetical protein
MPAPPEQGLPGPELTRVHDDEDTSVLAFARGPPNSIEEVQRRISLQQAKRKLGIVEADWLPLQQEISKYLKSTIDEYRTNTTAALAFLHDTGAKDRYFGLVADEEAEGMLVNRAGLAWGFDDDQYVRHAAFMSLG